MDVLRGHYPMLVLGALTQQAGHGYAVVQRLSEDFDLPEGTVYPILHKLQSDGLITGRWQAAESGRQIKVYSVTAKGRRVLSKQRSQWDRLVAAMASFLGAAKSGATP